MSGKDIIADARERYEAARDAMAENRERMLEELRFSNPTCPEQWDEQLRRNRENDEGGARPCLTFDQTNQYIRQEVNNARMNPASMKARPVDSRADPQVAGIVEGLFRHIEDASRAQIAYDCATEYQARIGLGFFRISAEVLDPLTNEQEIRILKIDDPLSVSLDPEWRNPDGSDAMWGQIETRIPKKRFEKLYPKADLTDFSLDSATEAEWFGEKGVRILEDFYVEEEKKSCITIPSPDGGEPWDVSEEQYWEIAKATGQRPPVLHQYEKTKRVVRWRKLTAADVLEETTFPSEYVPIIPMVGTELWVDGKRYFSGLVRPMMDAQRAYNYERSSYVEYVSLQPRVPYIVPVEGLDGVQKYWDRANVANTAYLPYKALGPDGTALPTPVRQPPPAMASAFVQGAELASKDIQAAIGMYNAAIGSNPNQQSGRALNQLQQRADTATAHYQDNRLLSIAHAGRIVLQMIPKIYDTRRTARILGEDGQTRMVQIDPSLQAPAVYKDRRMLAFNPNVGRYDVTAKAGPMFQTRRQEMAASLSEVVNGNPQMMALIGDVWMKAQDFPESEKVAARLKAMLPPQAAQAEAESEKMGDQPVPPQVQAQMQQMQMSLEQTSAMAEQMKQLLQAAEQEIQKLQDERDLKQAELVIKDRDSQVKALEAEARIQNMQADTANEAQDVRQDALAPIVQAISELQQRQTQPIVINSGDEKINVIAQAMDTALDSIAQSIQQAQMMTMQSVEQLAQEIRLPKAKTIEITAPSGRVFRGQSDGVNVEITSSDGKVYRGTSMEQ